MGSYLDTTDAEIIALTRLRQAQQKAIAAAVDQRTIRFSGKSVEVKFKPIRLKVFSFRTRNADKMRN